MRIKTCEFNEEKWAITCVSDNPGDMTFYIFDMNINRTYTETLTKSGFTERLRKLNSRIKFPEAAVRKVLLDSEGATVMECKDGATAGERILVMRYTVKNAPTTLKWEWHVGACSKDKIYDFILTDSINTMNGLRDLLNETTQLLKAKDKELAQYHAEGFSLRRTTVVTKPFQHDAFKEQYKQLMADVDGYNDFADDFHKVKPSPLPSPVVSSPSSSSSSSSRRAQNAMILSNTSSPSGSNSASTTDSSSSGAAKLTPRLRKRKAQESNTNYMERRVVERRVQHTFQSSQSSQEQDVDDYFLANERKLDPAPVVGEKSKSIDVKSEVPSTASLIKKETTGTGPVVGEKSKSIGVGSEVPSTASLIKKETIMKASDTDMDGKTSVPVVGEKSKNNGIGSETTVPVVDEKSKNNGVGSEVPSSSSLIKKESDTDKDKETPAQPASGNGQHDSEELELEELKAIFNATKEIIGKNTSAE